MPNCDVYAKQNFPCQITSKNAKFLEFGIKNANLATLAVACACALTKLEGGVRGWGGVGEGVEIGGGVESGGLGLGEALGGWSRRIGVEGVGVGGVGGRSWKGWGQSLGVESGGWGVGVGVGSGEWGRRVVVGLKLP